MLAGEAARSPFADDEDEEEGQRGKVTVRMMLRAIWGTKKDVMNVVGSAGMLGLLIWRLVRNWEGEGVRWWVFGVAAWVSG